MWGAKRWNRITPPDGAGNRKASILATCKAAGCHPIEETTKEIIYVLLTR